MHSVPELEDVEIALNSFSVLASHMDTLIPKWKGLLKCHEGSEFPEREQIKHSYCDFHLYALLYFLIASTTEVFATLGCV